VASRLRQEEAVRDWPPSIRVAVTVEMEESDLRKAACVIKQAVNDFSVSPSC